MNSENVSIIQKEIIVPIESELSRTIKFVVFIILEPVAVVCNIFLVYSLIVDKHLRAALHHHVILLLLLVTLVTNLVEIPRVLHFLYFGIVTSRSTASCLAWQWLDFLVYGLANTLMMWASFERHILVFHNNLLRTRRSRFFIHYLPLMSIVIYMITWYTSLVFFYPCERIFDYAKPLCGSPCFTNYRVLSLIDLLMHTWIPIFLSMIFSIALVMRVVYTSRAIHQNHSRWHRYRRMIIQLWSISLLYIGCLCPYSITEMIDVTLGLPKQLLVIKTFYLFYLYWFLTLLLPFTCLSALSEVTHRYRVKIRNWIHKTNVIIPAYGQMQHYSTMPLTNVRTLG